MQRQTKQNKIKPNQTTNQKSAPRKKSSKGSKTVKKLVALFEKLGTYTDTEMTSMNGAQRMRERRKTTVIAGRTNVIALKRGPLPKNPIPKTPKRHSMVTRNDKVCTMYAYTALRTYLHDA